MSNLYLSVCIQFVLSMCSLPQLIALRHNPDLLVLDSDSQRLKSKGRFVLGRNRFVLENYNQTLWQEEMDTPLPVKVVLNKQLDAPSVGTSNLCVDGRLVPEVMYLGAQKAGTTSVASVVLRHPRIRSFKDPPLTQALAGTFMWEKEPHVFDEGYRYSYGKRWWLESFPTCPIPFQRLVAVDFTPDYLGSPNAPARILAWYGNQAGRIKFYVCLRNPLKRAHSTFYMARSFWFYDRKAEAVTFSEYVARSLAGGKDILGWPYHQDGSMDMDYCGDNFAGQCSGPLGQSIYASQLRTFFRYFDSRQYTIYLFLHVVAPQDGRSVHDDVLEQVGLETVGNIDSPQDLKSFWPDRPTLSDDLNATLLQSLQDFIDERTGPKELASLLASSNARLYDYAGNQRDEDAIAQWISRGWG